MVKNEEELFDALDQFQEAVDIAETNSRVESYSTELERFPAYGDTIFTEPVSTSNRPSLDIPENFQFRDYLNRNNEIK